MYVPYSRMQVLETPIRFPRAASIHQKTILNPLGIRPFQRCKHIFGHDVFF